MISGYVLVSLGTMALVDALMNFNVHPKSDLQMYSQLMGGPADMWMYLWLAIAVIITGINAYIIYKEGGFLNEELQKKIRNEKYWDKIRKKTLNI